MENGTRAEVVKVRVNQQELAWLREIADAEQRTVSAVLRLALLEFYNRRVKAEA